MPNFLVRRPLLAKGGIQAGANGIAASQMIWGSACINSPSMIGDATASGSVVVSNVSVGETAIVTANASMPVGVVMYAAKAVSGGIAASFVNSGSAATSGSNDVGVSYLILS